MTCDMDGPFLGGLPPKPSPEAVDAAAGVIVQWGDEGKGASRYPLPPYTVTREVVSAAYAVDACPSGCPPPEGEK